MSRLDDSPTLTAPDSLIDYLDAEDGLFRLDQLMEDPSAFEPPTPVVPLLCWPGYTTLLAGREKVGKSTLAKAAAASVTARVPLFESPGSGTPASGRVLYYSLEEAKRDLGRKLSAFGARMDRVYVRHRLSTNPLKGFRRDLRHIAPSLCVADSLSVIAQHRALDPTTHLQWGRLVSELRKPVQDTHTALLLLHHARRKDGRYRGSSAIGATVDMILELRVGDLPAQRTVESSGRLETPDITYERVDDGPDGTRLRLCEVRGERPSGQRTDGAVQPDARCLQA